MIALLERVQVDTPAFVAGLAAGVVALTVLAVRYRRAPWPVRHGLRAGAPMLGLLTIAAGANTYFAYLPTLADVLGRRAALQASHAEIQHTLAAVRAGTAPASSAGPTPRAGPAATVPPRPVVRVRFPISGPAPRRALVGTAVADVGPLLTRPPALPAHGVVEMVNIPGTLSGFHARAAEVYLPPAWFDPSRPPLPVVVLLHGTPGTPADWTRGGEADLTADAWAAGHGGLAPILVMPDPNGSPFGDTECVDAKEGRAETYLTRDVPDFVISHYGAATDRSSWAIGGLSEGGQCAVSLTLRHPERFSVFMAFGADDHLSHDGGLTNLFPGTPSAAWLAAEAYAPRHLLTVPPAQPVAGWFGAGAIDGSVTAAAQRMAGLAQADGITVQVGLLPDAHHTFRVWRDCFAQALPWVASRLRLPMYPLRPPPWLPVPATPTPVLRVASARAPGATAPVPTVAVRAVQGGAVVMGPPTRAVVPGPARRGRGRARTRPAQDQTVIPERQFFPPEEPARATPNPFDRKTA